MGFTLVDPPPDQPILWAPVNAGATCYVGQIVYSVGDGVAPIGGAGAGPDATYQPFGLVVGTSDYEPTYDSATYKANYIAAVTTQAAQIARNWRMVEGPWSKGDAQAMVNIAVITPHTLLKGPICNAALGTAPTVQAAAAASTAGLAITLAAGDFTPVADQATMYCRTGANMGLYRVRDDTSTTAATVDVAFQYDVAAGDEFVCANMRPIGLSRCAIVSTANYIDVSDALTNYYLVFVHKLDLAIAGQEHAIFRFSTAHFD